MMFTSILVFTIISAILMTIIGIAIPCVIAFALGQLIHLGVFDIQHNDNKFMGCFWILVAGVCWFGFITALGIGIFSNEYGVLLLADTIGYIVLVGLFAVLTYFGFHTTAFINTEIDDPIEDKFNQVMRDHEVEKPIKSVATPVETETPKPSIDPDIKQNQPALAAKNKPMIVNFSQSQAAKASVSTPMRKVPSLKQRRKKHVSPNSVLY